LRKPGELKDYRFLRSDASNLAAFLHHIRINHRDYYDNIISTIQLVAPFFDDFILQPIPLSPDEILLEWKQKGYEQSFKANIFSDGTLRFICLAVLLLQPEPPAPIFLDEPELGLHPYALSLLADLIRVASQTTQLIVSTQSVSLVNHFAPEDIIVVDREGTRSIFRRLSREEMQEWLDDYSLGELWEKNILGGRPQ